MPQHRPWSRRSTRLARWLALGALVAGTVGLPTLSLTAAHAQTTVTTNQIPVNPPPMGWASWNSFAAQINSTVIKAQTDALVSSGMKDAGYRYVNIDEGWWQGTRDATGAITVDSTDWPGGMKAIADYIHSKGLKAGIYTDAGKNGCGYYFPTGRPAAPNTGSEGHYQQDFTQFEQWGFDYVKIDWCGGDKEGLDPKATYQGIRTALDAATATTGHPLVLSLCSWGNGNPWNWGAGVGDLWRTSNDIILFGQDASLGQVLTNFNQGVHPVGQHTGYVNDPDMLTVGMKGLSDDDARTEMSLWAVSGAPLLAGNNVATMTATTASILTNADVIAVDQDPRGLQGVKVAEDKRGQQVYSKVLSGSGRRAVVLLNQTSANNAQMTVRWADLGLANTTATVKNLWTGASTANVTASYSITVPANGSVLLTVSGTEVGATTYEAEASGNTLGGSAAAAACSACSGGQVVGNVGNGSANTLTVNGISTGSTGLAVATIAYVNGDSTTRTAFLNVNGTAQWPTLVAFPPTGSWSKPGTVSIIVSLGKGANTFTFGNSTAWAPNIDAIAVSAIPGAAGTSVVGTQSNRCLDLYNNNNHNQEPAELWDCTGGANQTWTAYPWDTDTSHKTLVVYGNKCLDDYGYGTANGSTVDIWDCNGGTNQQWTVNSDGTIRSVSAGLCLDASAGTGNGTKLVLNTCNGAASQRWTTDLAAAAPGSPSPSSSAPSSANGNPGPSDSPSQADSCGSGPGGASPSPSPASGPGVIGGLPVTGTNVMLIGILGAAAVAVGAVLYVVSRRRRNLPADLE